MILTLCMLLSNLQVQAPPGSNEQNQQAHYATVLAPMVPMMMPYGMMPYPAAPMPGGQPAQPQAFAHLPPQAAGPAVQQAPRGNDAFPGAAPAECQQASC